MNDKVTMLKETQVTEIVSNAREALTDKPLCKKILCTAMNMLMTKRKMCCRTNRNCRCCAPFASTFASVRCPNT
ncbi:Uncharacterised protein [Helicobacter pametensis]|nr:Uncharacterised protein [Helicobacter pametensis]